MASTSKRRPHNVEGHFYVDETCIDCGACRWMVPTVFDRADGKSRVHTQPGNDALDQRSAMAAVACPTGSIGAASSSLVAQAAAAFPDPITDRVFHLGFHSEKSFGAASYFIQRPSGNVMVDSPRYNRGLEKRIAALGGVAVMFMSHRDDVADHRKWHEAFDCRRVMHADDVSRSTAMFEQQVAGDEPVELADDLLMIPTPGHTRGSACLLFDDVLFTGDHLAYHRKREVLYAFSGACWYDWQTQIGSMAKLAEYDFAWILPGHGSPTQLAPGTSRHEIERCVDWMREQR